MRRHESLNPGKKKRNILTIITIFIFLIEMPLLEITLARSQDSSLSLQEIWIRDPYIFFENGTYYLTGTTANDGFLGYSSPDLVHWYSHGYIYRRNESNYWAQYNFWAPEIVKKDGLFYMFFSGKSDSTRRATGVAVAKEPMGPYYDLMPDPLTPPQHECLDGHLFRDDNGTEYFIYVYEWVQAEIGQMWIQQISDDYTHLLGEPTVLFKGTDPIWGDKVVDGPSMLKYNNTYYLFWSTFNHNYGGKYCVGYAYSENIWGPYTMSEEPIIWNDGGHSTWFIENNTGVLKIVYHEPNAGPERAQIRNLIWDESQQCWTVDPPDSPPPDIRPYVYITISSLMLTSLVIGIIIIEKEPMKKNSKV